MDTQHDLERDDLSREAEENHLEETLSIVRDNVSNYGREVSRMQGDIDEMLAHYHDNDTEVLTILNNTVTMHEHMKRALIRNEKALAKPYFGRIIFHDEALDKEESLYIGRGGIAKDTTHWAVVDWRAPVANAYYENGLGRCSYEAPQGARIKIDLKWKRTYEIEAGKLLDYFDSEVIANDDLLTKYLAKNKQTVLNEIVATIQKEQNEIIRKSPYHNTIVQGVAGSGKTTVAMHRISYILYNYEERFKPDDFYIVGSNRILLNYITGVLPDLDVYGVRQMTMEQLFVRLLYEDWDDKKYRVKSADTRRTTGRAGGSGSGRESMGDSRDRGAADDSRDRGAADDSRKGSRIWFADLEAYCCRLERDTISCGSVYLNPKQFVEGIRDGRIGVFDETDGKSADPRTLVRLLDGGAVERYVEQNPTVSIQSKIDMLNARLRGKIKEEFLGKGVKYTEAERKAILKAYRGHYGGRVWKKSIYGLYRDFLTKQREKGYDIHIPDTAFDVYDLAALAYLYKRVKETEVISEAHHIVIDEAQDYGMMAYLVLKYCIYRCTYTIMGDVAQNIHFGYGLNDWEELKSLFLTDSMDSFGVLKKSYRNTVEISDFATNILHHGRFSIYPVEPIIRHGNPVQVRRIADREAMIRAVVDICRGWQGGSGGDSGERYNGGDGFERQYDSGGGSLEGNHSSNSGNGRDEQNGRDGGLDTIAVICRDQESADAAAKELSRYVDVITNESETMQFGKGIMVLPVAYTKGLEFDAVLILDPSRQDYPTDDGHAKLLYVAATRALHELCVLHTGNLTGLIADPIRDGGERGRMRAENVESAAGRHSGLKYSGVDSGSRAFASDVGLKRSVEVPESENGEISGQRGLEQAAFKLASDSGTVSEQAVFKSAPDSGTVSEQVAFKSASDSETVSEQMAFKSAPDSGTVSKQMAFNPETVQKRDKSHKQRVSIVRNQMPDRNINTETKKRAASTRTAEPKENNDNIKDTLQKTAIYGNSIQRTDMQKTDMQKTDIQKTDMQKTDMQKTGMQKIGIQKIGIRENNIRFGDMPPTEILCPSGHAKIDLAVRWVVKQRDGLYLHSRYGVLRLSPVGSAIVRVTFAKGGQIVDRVNDKIAVHFTDKRWLYKESGATVDLMTDELWMQTDKSTGAIRYMTRDKKLLLAERGRECRQLENGADGRYKTWLYLDWRKNETVYGMGAMDEAGMNLRKTARYISHGSDAGELPFILSDQGYGIVMAADSPVISCDIPAYGSYLHAQSEEQMDFYFITGKRQNTIMNAYAYLCGKL